MNTKISAETRGCRICAVIERQPDVHWVDQPIMESERFIVLPSIGSLVPGWCLILPRTHEQCTAALDQNAIDEIEALALRLAERLSKEFGNPVYWFEHGPVTEGSPVGCSVDHAHLHVLPLHFSIVDELPKSCPMYSWAARDQHRFTLRHIRNLRKNDYIIAGDMHGKYTFAEHQAFPSQVVRRIIASRTAAATEWNWREHPHLDNARATASRFRQIS